MVDLQFILFGHGAELLGTAGQEPWGASGLGWNFQGGPLAIRALDPFLSWSFSVGKG